MFFVGTDENGNRVFYNTTSSKVSFSEATEQQVQDALNTSSNNIKYNSLDAELRSYGFTDEQINSIQVKINSVDNGKSTAEPFTYTDANGAQKVNSNGSLVSNSAQSLKNTTDFQKAMLEIEKAKLVSMNASNATQRSILDMHENNLIMQSYVYTELVNNTKALHDLKVATENLKLSPTYQAGQINVTVPDFDIPAPVVNVTAPDVNVNPTVQVASPTVNIDTTAIANATNASNQALTDSLTAQTTAITNQTNVIKTSEDAKLVEMKNHIEAVKAQKFDASFGDVSVTMNTEALNANTQKTADAIEKIANANEKIALGQENQIQTNTKIVENIEKKNEHLDYLKNGHDTLKDSEGNKIIPRDIQAKKDAEVHIDKESLNKTTIEEIMEFNQDIREFIDGNSPEGVFSDLLGATSGFVDNLNPLKAILQNVLNSHEKEHNPEYQTPKEGA